MKLVILAGGSGTRLWPVSRKDSPKQVRSILGNQTLLENTYERLRSRFLQRDIYIATNINQLDIIKEKIPSLPDKNYIIEPSKKDTAAAIGLAAAIIHKKNPRDIMVNINSDHFIRDEIDYARVLKQSEEIIRKNPRAGLLIGINPTYPETGYGYIKFGEQVRESRNYKYFQVDEFVEKPDKKTAEEYVQNFGYLWNSGSFMWRVDALLDLYRRFLPDQYRIFMKIRESLGTKDESKVIKREFNKIRAISIDYGIIERAPSLMVVPTDFGWADVGNWGTVKDILSKKPKNNITKGKVVHEDCEDNLIYNYSDKLVTVLGAKGLVVIETEDSLLVVPKNKTSDLKKIIKRLKIKKYQKYL